MLCSKISFISTYFSTRLCALLCTRTVLESSVYYNYRNHIHFYAFLVKITAVGYVQVSCLKVLKLLPYLFLNFTNGSPLCSPAFSRFFQNNLIKLTNTYKTYVLSLHFWKKLSKRPTIQTSMSDIRRSYVIGKNRIGTMSKGSDIQRLYLWLIRPGNQVLCVASHQGKVLNINIWNSGRNLEHFINLEHFRLSCIHPVHCLRTSAKFHHM